MRGSPRAGWARTGPGCGNALRHWCEPKCGLYVSDDQIEDEDDPRFWVQVDADRNPPSSYPIAGLGLVCRTDPNGAGCGARISIIELKSRIRFTQRKFRGFQTQIREAAHGPHLVVEMKAPLIDRTDEINSKP